MARGVGNVGDISHYGLAQVDAGVERVRDQVSAVEEQEIVGATAGGGPVARHERVLTAGDAPHAFSKHSTVVP